MALVQEAKVKLSELEYVDTFNRYLQLLLSGKKKMDDIKGYLIRDNISDKQAQKMLKGLEKEYQEKIDEVLDEKLFRVLEILEMPTKWVITQQREIKEVYPHPVLNEEHDVIGIQYKLNRSYLLPELLFKRYELLVSDIQRIEGAYKQTESNNNKKVKEKKANQLMYVWLQEYEAGHTITSIADEYGYSSPTVSKYIKLAREARA
ncbi:hypothetical protein [Pseudobacillus badius]|uniref:hypothetical protein n=1 Tax=Bacillus badius TaxID=1455 RepID=UPI0024A02BC9|nr:hypothetical protein [Bacillus badius]GLY12511.1 hypothetical protein Bbad01_37270 [Bacillus badius]